MGRFLKKCHTEYFLIYHFGKPLECPATSQQWFTRTTKFGKLALKKGCACVRNKRTLEIRVVASGIFDFEIILPGKD
jgi:hypothetical protein